MAVSVTRVNAQDALAGPVVEAMNFLNGIADRFPDAISLASGRPPDQFIPAAESPAWMARYVSHVAAEQGLAEGAVWERLGQYAPTKGIVQGLVADFLRATEGLEVAADQLMLTNGYQEALVIALQQLALVGGAVLTPDPTYVGLTGAAMTCGLPVFGFTWEDDFAAGLQAAAEAARAAGFAQLAAYVIPDFDNPSGRHLDRVAREAILAVAEDFELTLLEDLAYRYFGFGGDLVPSLFALDGSGRVIQVGSFAKSVMPGLRLGYSLSQGTSPLEAALPGGFAAVAKSFLSVTTAPLVQAMLGGFMLTVGEGFHTWNADRLAFCRANRDLMLTCLAAELDGLDAVSFSRPDGGFFVQVDLPFAFGMEETLGLAADYHVIVTPMRVFSLGSAFDHSVRLAFSNAAPDALQEGVRRFASFVRTRLTV